MLPCHSNRNQHASSKACIRSVVFSQLADRCSVSGFVCCAIAFESTRISHFIVQLIACLTFEVCGGQSITKLSNLYTEETCFMMESVVGQAQSMQSKQVGHIPEHSLLWALLCRWYLTNATLDMPEPTSPLSKGEEAASLLVQQCSSHLSRTHLHAASSSNTPTGNNRC